MLPDSSDETSDEDDSNPVPSTSTASSHNHKPVWHTQELSDVPSVESVFRGEVFTGNAVQDHITYFCNHLDGEMKANFISQLNLLLIQTNPNKPLAITEPELEQFIGMLFYMRSFTCPVLKCSGAWRCDTRKLRM